MGILLDNKCSVAVIGAGAAGLVAARELHRQGHTVTVYEQNPHGIGGVWRYTPETEEDDPLGISPHRKSVHTSMYLSLRTNIPREIMGYLDFPFLPKEDDPIRDPRRFPVHQEVLHYLEDFAMHFDLLRFVQFGRRVKDVSIHRIVTGDKGSYNYHSVVADDLKNIHSVLELYSQRDQVHQIEWNVVSENVKDASDVSTDTFDAVVVCNGHYFQPKLVHVPGIDKWPGLQIHSHNYRVPDPFTDKIVVVIGNSFSGADISREIASVCKEVHWAGRKWDSCVNIGKPLNPYTNIIPHPMVISADQDGSIQFDDGASVNADVVLYCTGYGFSLPFLRIQSIVNVDPDHIWPLYQHIFPPALAPFLSFVGCISKAIPFPIMELQSKWIAMILAGKVVMPSRKEIKESIDKFYLDLKIKGLRSEDCHNLNSNQFEYANWLANLCQCSSLESWRSEIYLSCSIDRQLLPESFRDDWTNIESYTLAMTELQAFDIHTPCTLT